MGWILPLQGAIPASRQAILCIGLWRKYALHTAQQFHGCAPSFYSLICDTGEKAKIDVRLDCAAGGKHQRGPAYSLGDHQALVPEHIAHLMPQIVDCQH